MIPNTPLAYVLIRSSIFALRAVTPLAFLYCATALYALFAPQSIARHALATLPVSALAALTIFCVNEVWFFFYARRKVRRHQALATAAAKLSQAQRKVEFKRAIESVHDPRVYLEGWFKGARLEDIGYDNVLQWTLWAFFDAPAEPESLYTLPEDILAEAKRYTDAWETRFNVTFQPGFNHKIESIRLSLDPVLTTHRPACVYLGVGVLYDYLAYSRYRSLGFKHYIPSAESGHRVSYPYIGLPSSPSNSTLTYWYKPCAPLAPGEKEDLPIVFVHGIGAGLKVYRTMITDMCARYPRSAIYLLEIPCVAMKLVEKLPVRAELVRDVVAMLKNHGGHTEALFAGHSLGTVVVSWILHLAPQVCRKVMLIDPVVWLLHYPDVAYNFLHRPPSNANQWLYNFFVCSEPGIARFLGRGFVWHENVLWFEDVPAHCEMRVYLAENDMIVNIPKVFEYLTGQDIQAIDRGQLTTGDEVVLRHPDKRNVSTHLWLGPDMDHAVFLLKQKPTENITAAFGELISGK